MLNSLIKQAITMKIRNQTIFPKEIIHSKQNRCGTNRHSGFNQLVLKIPYNHKNVASHLENVFHLLLDLLPVDSGGFVGHFVHHLVNRGHNIGHLLACHEPVPVNVV